jgi:hypothetical protein
MQIIFSQRDMASLDSSPELQTESQSGRSRDSSASETIITKQRCDNSKTDELNNSHLSKVVDSSPA